MTSVEPVIEGVISHAQYLDRIQQACSGHGEVVPECHPDASFFYK